MKEVKGYICSERALIVDNITGLVIAEEIYNKISNAGLLAQDGSRLKNDENKVSQSTQDIDRWLASGNRLAIPLKDIEKRVLYFSLNNSNNGEKKSRYNSDKSIPITYGIDNEDVRNGSFVMSGIRVNKEKRTVLDIICVGDYEGIIMLDIVLPDTMVFEKDNLYVYEILLTINEKDMKVISPKQTYSVRTAVVGNVKIIPILISDLIKKEAQDEKDLKIVPYDPNTLNMPQAWKVSKIISDKIQPFKPFVNFLDTYITAVGDNKRTAENKLDAFGEASGYFITDNEADDYIRRYGLDAYNLMNKNGSGLSLMGSSVVLQGADGSAIIADEEGISFKGKIHTGNSSKSINHPIGLQGETNSMMDYTPASNIMIPTPRSTISIEKLTNSIEIAVKTILMVSLVATEMGKMAENIKVLTDESIKY